MTETGDGEGVAVTPEALARTAVERSNLYGFLASVFREEVSAGLLKSIKEPEFLGALSESGVDIETDFLDRPEEQVLEDLAIEYKALFLGPGGHVSPYESAQIEGGSGLLWGPETIAVKRYIETAGFHYKPDYHGLPDHIGVELEFMAELAGKEAAAWRDGDVAKASNCLQFEHEFLADHLGAWAPAFCRQTTERAELSFYRDVARLTADFLAAEKLEIEERQKICAQKE
ncbi:MAG: molecular chaperone TorD family protein [Rhodospirillales bacterium]|jgi:TorA maturation chaperone TorD|nr:molecular chaperone TorD family protein [Rhodospirillales bacterium]